MRQDPRGRSGGQRSILLIGPDGERQRDLQTLLQASGFRVIRVEGPSEANRKFAALEPDAVLADFPPSEVDEPAATILRLLDRAQSRHAPAPVLVLNEGGWDASVDRLASAGAVFLTEPISPGGLLLKLAAALEGSTGAESAAQPLPLPPDLVIGRSTAIQRVLEQVRMVAPKDTSVLITGETGTGKEHIARAIHLLSGRRRLPMISVNCGGIPATLLEDEFFGHMKGAFTDAHQARIGRFEQAHRGTLFLDEIGDLPLELQPKLLRALQERVIHRVGGVEGIHLDIRVIAATNADLWTRVGEGRFREDLFYRTNVFPIHLPPLRERREDIPLFVEHFLEKFCRRDRLAPKRLRAAAEAELMSRRWPGNIRQLENAVEIAVIRSQDREDLDISDFPPPRTALVRTDAAAVTDLKRMVIQFEKDLILRVLERTGGNKTQAARILGLKRTTLVEKLRKYQVDDRDSGG